MGVIERGAARTWPRSVLSQWSAILGVLACLGGDALAQTGDDPDPSHVPTTGRLPPTGNPWHKTHEKSADRSGMAFGLGLGYGLAGGVGDTSDAVAFDVRLGWRFPRSRALVAFDVFFAVPRTAASPERHFIHVAAGVLAQFWLAPRYWIGPGAGLACVSPRNAEDCDQNAFSLRGLAGYELVHRAHAALDVELHAGAEIFDDDVGAYAMLFLSGAWFDIF